MKKIISIVLLCTMLLACFAGCGAKKGQIDLNSYTNDVLEQNVSGTAGVSAELKANIEKAKAGTFADDEVDVWDKENGQADDSWYDTASTDKEYTITTAAELLGFRAKMVAGTDFQGWTIKLGKNIDFADATLEGISASFKGTFDGQNHVIYNYDMNLNANTGFFGQLISDSSGTYTSTIKNFALVDATCIVKGDSVGSVAYEARYQVEINNVYSEAEFSVAPDSVYSKVGGFVGNSTKGKNKTFRNCEFAGSINFGENEIDYVAGFLAACNGGAPVFEDCLNSGDVATKGKCVAGFLAYNSDVGKTSYTGCVNSGDISGGNYVGGFTGQAKKQNASNGNQFYKDCVNTGSITGKNYVGGIVGQTLLYGTTMKTTHATDGVANVLEFDNCDNSGNVTATGNVGGLAGYIQALTVTLTNCEFSGILTATFNVADQNGFAAAGLIGVLFDSTQDKPADFDLGATITNCAVSGTLTVDKYVLNCDVNGSVARLGIDSEDVTISDLTNTATVTNTLHSTMVGYQESVAAGGVYDLRFVAAFDNVATANGLGFTVSVYYKDENGKQTKLENEIVYAVTAYTSITGTGTEGEETYTAASFQADYLYTLVISEIPTSYTIAGNTLEVVVTPFTAENADTISEGNTVRYGEIVIE